MNRPRTALFAAAFAAALVLTGQAAAQLGQMISPGPLSQAHAKLEGASNCVKCHEQGKKVSAQRCLDCHKPVAARIAQKRGVHRDVKDDCVSCHVEHMGRDAELRPFDAKKFNHLAEAGFPLDGKHAGLECARCHKKRTFLDADPRCSSCHKDPHKGTLGTDCQRCHTTAAPFKDSRNAFDHSKTQFPLEGAHKSVACAKCHTGGKYKGLAFQSCTSCHTNPHRANLGTNCTSCHTVASWKVQEFDHARTGTPLLGKHRTVACARCHVRPATQVRLQMKPCATCHQDPHKGQFRKDCAACHNENGFRGAPFDHTTTRFPLTGKHAAIPCANCHKTRGAAAADFRGLKMECAACHQDPHRGDLGTSCERCHGTASFKVASFTHPRFAEFFAGGHANVACEKCHPVDTRSAKPVRVLKNVSTDCVSCHRDVHLGQMPRCADCHTVAAAKFKAAAFRHENASFKLAGKHAAVRCDGCHKQETAAFPSGNGTAVRYRGLASTCASCHKDVHLGQLGTDCGTCHTADSFRVATYQHRTQPAFFAGKHAAAKCDGCHRKVESDFPAGHGTAVKFKGLATDCAGCHKDAHAGQLGTSCRDCHAVDTAWRSASRAFHKAGLFPLEGRHLTTPCADCHRNGVIKGTPTRCFDCHWNRRQDDRFHTALGNECESCHRPIAWTAVVWNHAANTGFPLGAAHDALSCDGCHTGGAFTAARTECESCHLKDYSAATSPNHQALGFPVVCRLCHRTADPSWNEGRFDHSGFTLAGAHATAQCGSCHAGGVYQGTARDCATCHRADVQSATSPNHTAAGFTGACDSCHRFTDASWQDATYVHAQWQLAGSHAAAGCADCHKGSVYAGLSSDCASCHKPQYDASTSPAHAAAGFPLACDLCHRPADTAWTQGRFDHSTFALAGAHTTAACSDCHRNGVYKGTATTCSGCHTADFDAAKDPDHRAAGFPSTCDTCHRFADSAWSQGRFDHTTFALLGAHAAADCTSCHANGVYKGTSRVCSGCHLADYNASTAPNHAAAGFSTSCDSCHRFTDATWNDGRFDHATFGLLGAHATAPCASCHVNGVYKGTSRICSGCHLADYNATKEPNHAAAAFPTTCDGCHKFTDLTWTQATFAHTTFPLAGVHLQQVCLACHTGGVYAGTPRNCSGCHQDNYDATTSPKHSSAGFPTTCESCHKFTDLTWNQGLFAHLTFPLAGVHATEPCTSCHSGGVYAGTARTCAGCHQAKYDATTDPKHSTAGFPTTCDTCHKFTDLTWQQGIFSHTTFALSGVHATQPCSACHAGGIYAGTPRTCAGCHLPKYNATTDPPHSAAGFPTSCESCHKYTDTSWNQGVFDHAIYRLRGKHATAPCSACHAGGVYAGTPRTCVGCHLADYNATRDPNHAAAGFPTTCDSCHKSSDSSWDQGVFNHSFPIRSGAHAGEPCSSCHTNPSNYSIFTCTTCHTRSQTDPDHSGVPGYSWSSPACYSCHPNGQGD